MMMRNMITNNTMSKITILLFAIILMSAAPFASAQWAVGGSHNSGGVGFDKDPPLFVGNSITIDQAVLVDGPGNEPVVVSAGDTVEFVVTASDNRGVDNITHIDIFLNHDGKRILNNLQETYVSFHYDDFKIQNPSGLIGTATIDTSLAGDDKKFTFNVTFDEPFDTSNVLVRAWDAYSNISMLYLLDSLKVVPATIDESTPTESTPTESTPTESTPTESTPTESTPAIDESIDTPVDVPENVSDDVMISSENVENAMESVLPYSIMLSGAEDVIPYDITGGAITGSTINLDNNSIVLNLSAVDDGTLTISPSESTQSGIFMVLVDGEESDDVTIDGNTVTVPFNAGAEEIEIIGTFVIPEFGTIAAMILAVAIISIVAISSKSRLGIVPRY
jgi:predicted secreted protein with PEFG-CTERM motif